MDLIYKIYSVYLYDNQLDHDYFILYNRRNSYSGLNWDLPFSEVFKEIYTLEESQKKSQSVILMKEACEKEGILMVKTTDFITLKKIGSGNARYEAYDIFWNETKSGINIHEFEVAAKWSEGASQYSTYRILEAKAYRREEIISNSINSLLNS